MRVSFDLDRPSKEADVAMRSVFLGGFVVGFLLVFTGCGTADYSQFYYLSTQSMPVPVMFGSSIHPQRQFHAAVSQDSSVSQSTYYGYDYTVTTTTSSSQTTTANLEMQIYMNARPNDTVVTVGELIFFSHRMGAPGYGETHTQMGANIGYVE